MKNLPVGQQSFEKVVTRCVYVDKTKHIYDLMSKGECYFLSRPRRFGKSLLCSTLEMLFKNRRDLFKNTWIDTSDYDWQEYPVIHLSMGAMDTESPETLHNALMEFLTILGKEHNLVFSQYNISPKIMFVSSIQQLQKKYGPVVVIIDEYDKPILDNINNLAAAQAMRDVLRNFYGALKDLEPYLRFTFITGVSKFSRTSIFSGMNHLIDLSLDEQAITLCGYTAQEIEDSFAEHIQHIAEKRELSTAQVKQDMKLWYNGYRFEETQQDLIYNPFSILNFLSTGKLKNYWFESGSPTFLLNILKKKNYQAVDLEETELSCSAMDAYDVSNMDVKVLLFQTGYLTIKPGSKTARLLTVGIPNEEVRLSLFEQFAHMVTDYSYDKAPSVAELVKTALAHHDLQKFTNVLRSFLADIPYQLHIKDERYYQSVFYILYKLCQAPVVVEEPTNKGRIDALMVMPNHIYIFEFKVNKSVDVAMDQIYQRKYFEKFLLMQKPITLVGINFSTTEKTVDVQVIENNVCTRLFSGDVMSDSRKTEDLITRVRLKAWQIDAIVSSFVNNFLPVDHLWIFGSRVNVLARGGDIDLYIETEVTDSQDATTRRINFLIELKKKIGDQKIDVVLRRLASDTKLDIYEVAQQEGVLLV